jgi:crotonobetainyl-CoA:carnitine CoA-transferase CaiB-like acyl-CoA transferase
MTDVRTATTEPGPLAGFRVVELGMWVAGPAVGAVLADWGAEVIKIEPLDGDPQRRGEGFAAAGGPHLAFNPSFDVTNRGKRSIAVDLKSSEGREIVAKLIAEADVVTGSMRLKALKKLGFDYDTLAQKHPRLVYALLSGFGTEGPDADTFGYDMGAIWCLALHCLFNGARWVTERQAPCSRAVSLQHCWRASAAARVSWCLSRCFAGGRT